MNTNKRKPFVFVLMPFSDRFTDVYTAGIQPACSDAGVYCERVDEQTFSENILERIYNQIAEADIIIADMTGRNPNVFYETGYARALNKRIILLTDKVAHIPFDLTLYKHIVYAGKVSILRPELEKWVRFYLDNDEGSLSNPIPSIKASALVIDKQTDDSIPREWRCRSLYIGLSGAKNWLSIMNDSDYRTDYFEQIMTKLLKEHILKELEINTVVSLGTGDGATDEILCGHLGRKNRVKYVPVDINPYLLAKAIARVAPTATTEFGVVCDFEEELLSFLKDIIHTHAKPPYLFTLLGYTLCNLDTKEGKFLSRIRKLMREGDYLLFDYIAIDDEWSYDEYCKTWHHEWDTMMRKFICDAISKRRNEAIELLMTEFDARFSFENGKSDVSDSYGTYIRHRDSGLRVFNVRRYKGFGNWLEELGFQTILEKTQIQANHAGTGYILAKRLGS
jgi:histidine-specific SAM-dependent methyltransferase